MDISVQFLLTGEAILHSHVYERSDRQLLHHHPSSTDTNPPKGFPLTLAETIWASVATIAMLLLLCGLAVITRHVIVKR